MPQATTRHEVSVTELLLLGAGLALAIVPSLPFVRSEGPMFLRFHHWAIFVGGLLIGAVLMRARLRLER